MKIKCFPCEVFQNVMVEPNLTHQRFSKCYGRAQTDPPKVFKMSWKSIRMRPMGSNPIPTYAFRLSGRARGAMRLHLEKRVAARRAGKDHVDAIAICHLTVFKQQQNG